MTPVYLGKIHIANLLEHPDKTVTVDVLYGKDIKDCRNMEIAN